MSNNDVLPIHSPTNSLGKLQTYPPISMGVQHRHARSSSMKAKGIARLTVHIPSSVRSDAQRPNSSEKLSPPRWKTLEFKIYYLVALFAIPAMIWIPVSLSSSSNQNYNAYAPRLSDGWLFGREVDNSDGQYRSFRSNFILLLNAALGYLAIRLLHKKFTTPLTHQFSRIPMNVVLSLLTVGALHGTSALKILVIMAINYVIAKKFQGHKLAPLLTWAFNGAVLFANEVYHGYRFGSIGPSLQFLDDYSGVYPRWHISFNITMLRLISFNMDYHWACKYPETADDSVTEPSEKQRTSIPHPKDTYSIANYIAYILYPPLYITGPIITFNDFMWQHRRPKPVDWRANLMYLLRFFICFMTMEFVLHFMYVVAIKDTRAWIGDSPAQIAMIGFWNLIIVWLKLLIPWRFFRAWALLDGIDAPENMVRCMANNYSTFGFWRSWHRSYNLWIIRYLYIPMGGSKNLLGNTVLVFSFVALWHDLTFRLLAWGWLVSLFVVPEVIASYALPASKYGMHPWYRHICAVGGVLNVLMMMVANLVGFVIGLDGVEFFMSQLFGTWEGIQFMVVCSACLFVGVQLMFEYREEEHRQGIYRRC